MKTILVVDDNINYRLLVKEELEEKGYEVLTAGTGREALEILENPSLTVNLVITDLHHPEIGGFEFLRLIKKGWPDLSLICHSAYSGHFMDYEAWADDYIMKSIDFTELINSVNKLIGGPG